MIYAGGFQSAFRPLGFSLLAQGIAIDVDEISQASLFVEKGAEKIRTKRQTFIFVVPKQHMETTLARLAAADPQAQAYAVPVLASIGSADAASNVKK